MLYADAEIELDKGRAQLAGTEYWEFIEDDKSLGFNSPKFIEYRRSAAYLLLKMLRQELDGNCCTKCKSVYSLHFHHLIYRRIFKERLTDGVTLCKNCHLSGHDIRNKLFNTRKTKINKESNMNNTLVKSDQFIKKWASKWLEDFSKHGDVALADNRIAAEMGMNANRFRRFYRYVWGIKEKQVTGKECQGKKSESTKVPSIVNPKNFYATCKILEPFEQLNVISDAVGEICSFFAKSAVPADRTKMLIPSPLEIISTKIPSIKRNVVEITKKEELFDSFRLAHNFKDDDPGLYRQIIDALVIKIVNMKN